MPSQELNPCCLQWTCRVLTTGPPVNSHIFLLFFLGGKGNKLLYSLYSYLQFHCIISSYLFCLIGEGNGNPLQYTCLESPVDKRAWWAAVHGVAQSWTRLKRLSMHACLGEGNGNPLVFSPGESQGRGSLVGCRLWGRTVGHD